ncbi:MAG: LacI family transcriptional regulator [Treponema sp.]|jgi:LacI family transcriptional regulator/LacI family repressor for deo operon, udp, cdd, tsx, nupC, and nupG|nr:LacI family transcriptional regulator [Treponema sp.]
MPGKFNKMHGMREVAKQAGVALSTVSTVLNNSDKYVSEEIRQKVWSAAKELDYNLALNKRSSHKTIAVVLPFITSSFFSNVLYGIEDVVSKSNDLLLFYNSDYSFEKERNCFRTLNRKITGIILDSLCPLNMETEYFNWLEEEFISKGIPVLVLERRMENESFYCIYNDNYKYAYIATLHLIELGHRKITHITGSPLMLQTQERLNGYIQALRDYNIPMDQELIRTGDFTPYSGYLAMKNLMDICNDFTALFSANDQMAIGAIKALRANGKTVPWDCAVVGFDNISVSTLIEPSLSTINVPAFQMGRLAARLIMDANEGRFNPAKNQMELNLIVRRSSDINAIYEWELAGW